MIRKTLFAIYKLNVEANYWWDAEKDLEGTSVVTWKQFTKLFLHKHFPKYLENHVTEILRTQTRERIRD